MNIFKWGEQKVQKFKIWDISVMKTYLVSVGVVLGAYFPDFFRKYIWAVAILIVLTASWLIYKLFKK